MAHQSWFHDLVITTMVLWVLVSGCSTLLQPIEPGTTISEGPGIGLAFGRIAIIRDGEDRMATLPSFPRSFGWELLQPDSGRKFVVDPLTEDGVFALLLPVGLYHVTKLRYEDRYGLWEGALQASFVVKAGRTYIGTWELLSRGTGGAALPLTARIHDDWHDERQDFEVRYHIDARPVTVGLLQSADRGYLSLVRPRSEQ
jgi:hypothetical protein